MSFEFHQRTTVQLHYGCWRLTRTAADGSGGSKRSWTCLSKS